MKRKIFLAALLVALLVTSAPASAQTNLLTNPSFNPPYTNGDVAGGWTSWTLDTPPDFYQEQFGSTRTAPGSQAVLNAAPGARFTAGVYQVVNGLPTGVRVQATIYAQIAVINPGWTQQQLVDSNSRMRIGIDPNGGTNPLDSDIVWSAEVSSRAGNAVYDGTSSSLVVPYTQIAIEATTTGSAVTIYLYGTQATGAIEHRQFWDDATLIATGPGGAITAVPGTGPVAPVPTTPPTVNAVPFVNPQGTQPDGSIVHTVQAGDTIDSIAFAYGTTRETIMQLNGISNPRIISIGQRLIIRPANTPAAGGTAGGTSVAAAASPTTGSGAPALATNTPANSTPTTPDGAAATNTDAPPPTPTAPPASSTPAPTAPVVAANPDTLNPAVVTGTVCVLLFEDSNQNALQDSDEAGLPGGTIGLQSDAVDHGTQDTTSDAVCFADISAGAYTARAAAPDGYGLTSPAELRLQVLPGETLTVAFGAAQGFVPAIAATTDAAAQTAPTPLATPPPAAATPLEQLFAYSGVIVLGLAGLVLVAGVVATVILRRR